MGAPSEAWHFLRGVRYQRVRTNHSPVLSVACLEEVAMQLNERGEAYTEKLVDHRGESHLLEA